jgi:hypothetical protein
VIAGPPPPLYPWPIGVGPRYQPGAASAAVEAGRPVGTLRCRSGGATFSVHVELFARRRVVIVPARIGIGPKHCAYPVRTRNPTGVVEVGRSGLTLGDLFRVWGRRCSRSGLLSFRGPVAVFVHGKRWPGKPESVPLTKHAQIVIEVGGYVAPHPSYLFPKGDG